LSRKIGEVNFGSRGASVNVELELDANIISDPAKLQERIREIFTLVRSSLADELNGNGHVPNPARDSNSSKPPTTNENGTSRSGRERQATQSQIKAIYAIARSQQIDVGQFLRERFRVMRPDELTIKEASTAIDELKRNTSDGKGAG
jgi:hypothetical protein